MTGYCDDCGNQICDCEPMSEENQLTEQEVIDWLTNENEKLKAIIEDQLRTITALNTCIGGEGSLTTDNLTRITILERQLELTKDALLTCRLIELEYGSIQIFDAKKVESVLRTIDTI